MAYQSDIRELKARLQAWMVETDHPAATLMKDPQNPRKIAAYMRYEFEDAKQQIEELKHER